MKRRPGRSTHIEELARDAGMSERDYLVAMMNKYGTKARAAVGLDMHISSVGTQLAKHGIKCETRHRWFSEQVAKTA